MQFLSRKNIYNTKVPFHREHSTASPESSKTAFIYTCIYPVIDWRILYFVNQVLILFECCDWCRSIQRKKKALQREIKSNQITNLASFRLVLLFLKARNVCRLKCTKRSVYTSLRKASSDSGGRLNLKRYTLVG